MKLIVKTSLHYLWLSLSILLATGAIFYLVLRDNISSEIREQLELQVDMISQEVEKGHQVIFPLVELKELSAKTIAPSVFKDTLIYDHLQDEHEGYYYLSETKIINNKPYNIKVMTTYIGWNEYLKTISLIFLGLTFLLVTAGIVVNYFISKNIWRPFLNNLSILKEHSVQARTDLALEKSDIDEFEQLNAVLHEYADRNRKEYTGLQEFTENASHELQTPISIIRARLEGMSQLPLTNEAVNYVSDAKQALDRLSKVNKGLLLLAKLTHDNFPDQQALPVSAILTGQIVQLEELFESRGLKLQQDIQKISVKASPHLFDILIANFLSNILKHANREGFVAIVLDSDKLNFTNEGEPLPFAEKELFARFKKNHQPSAGVGLGLSIINQICLVHKWRVTYQYTGGRHNFTVWFNNN
ncbi:HAMP domain-containing histidine kinase [Mucilaginibacter sp. UR6-1]|uniref:sensor histidine kinase n=1 Tax=Mucilaginibacter sp. UR6-1 TaxID=1435643 RepID=UPI001E6144C8|nr:HAMP domain-containing sensor histidine kinase [Mucilaginibacter sp. UR6-1]MCC8411201.1 HAMP domain-containing histidine kinase [Mucilaginibacter sp. UR6-1]